MNTFKMLTLASAVVLALDAQAAPICPGGGTKLNIVQGLDWINGASLLNRAPPVNLVRNGDFTLIAARSGTLDSTKAWQWAPNATDAGLGASGYYASWIAPKAYQYVNVPEWTVTGGGTKTYAYVSDATTYNGAPVGPNFGATAPLMQGASPTLLYFGNAWAWVATPTVTYEIGGEVSRGAYTFTNTAFSVEELGDTTQPLRITQTVATVPGRKYRMQFVQLVEGADAFYGTYALEVTGYGRSYLRVDNAARRKTFEFVATSASTEIAFLQHGHYSAQSGLSTELALDDVIINECVEPTPVPTSSEWSLMLMLLMITLGAGYAGWSSRRP